MVWNMSQVQQITHFPLHRKARLQNDNREGGGGGGGTDGLAGAQSNG